MIRNVDFNKSILSGLAFGVSLMCVSLNVSAAAGAPAIEPKVETFKYQGVTIQDGLFKKQVDEVRGYYLNIADDDLLKPFRVRVGVAAPGKDLGGWYSSDTFHIFGQVVSGLSRLYAATGDVACRDKANHLVTEWSKCIAPDGYFYSAPPPNAPHYIYDKVVGGLVDNYLYCNNHDALSHLERITDWAIKNLDRDVARIKPTTEWYTLSENLYRAYLITGKRKYRDFAEVWEYADYWGLYANGVDLFDPADARKKDHYHAYSHVNTLASAGMAYAVKGKSNYLATIVRGFEYLRTNELFATGGFGPDERLLPRRELADALQSTHKSFETQCGAWAVFKLSKQLIGYTGDASAGDWTEHVAINGLCASIPMSPQGNVFYYSDYNLHGAEKINVDFPWACCAGTRPQAAADLDDLVYFKDADDLFVNLFTASTVQWNKAGQMVTLVQKTAFPESDTVTLEVHLSRPTVFGLKVRVPQWLAAPMEGHLNGAKISFAQASLHWATVQREWEDGDSLSLKLPMALRFIPLQQSNSFPAAVAYDPVVLAFQAGEAKQIRQLANEQMLKQLKPVSGKPLHFTFEGDTNVTALPFYSIPAKQCYYMYVSPNVGAQISTAKMRFHGQWSAKPRFYVTKQAGAVVHADFNGTGISWKGYRFPDAGRGEVTIDGSKITVVDQYGKTKGETFSWAHQGLAPGRHSIEIQSVPGKNPLSSGRFLNISALEEIERAEAPR